jgi:hypothetical protein
MTTFRTPSITRCIRCGSDPITGNLFCDRCLPIVEMQAQHSVTPVRNTPAPTTMSPWVRRNLAHEQSAKEF